MADGTDDEISLTSRPPDENDLAALCRELHRRDAKFLVVGGFAVILLGYPRTTGDIDFLIEASPENEKKVFDALATLSDECVRELEAGDIAKYGVVRVADEIVVDLMAQASGIDYEEAKQYIIVRDIDGVPVPCADTSLLLKMKQRSVREKDRADVYFLKNLPDAQKEA